MINSSFVEGKVVLITGASRGIDRATALALGRAGAKILLGDLDEKAAERIAAGSYGSGRGFHRHVL